MNLENCHCLSIRNKNYTDWKIISSYERIDHHYYSPILCVNEFMNKLKMACLRSLWRKIKKEKKRFLFLFNSSSNHHHVVHHHSQYDHSSYLQNFDDGYSSTDDPDNFSRSFSARFAMPSKFFEKNNNNEVMIMEGVVELLEINDNEDDDHKSNIV